MNNNQTETTAADWHAVSEDPGGGEVLMLKNEDGETYTCFINLFTDWADWAKGGVISWRHATDDEAADYWDSAEERS